MFKSITIAAAALATIAAGVAPTAASAQRYGGGDRYEQAYRDAYRDGYNHGPRYRERYGYRDGGRYYDRGDYRYRDYRRCDGTTGTIVGAIAGGLLGNAVAGRGDGALGAILGAGGGALAGRAVDRGNCR